MVLWQALIFGVVEGITEFLPISSTGHLILTARLMGLAQTTFLKSFEIAIQSGAILAVVVLYGKTVVLDREIIKRIIAAFVPTVIAGLLFYKIIKGLLLNSTQVVLGALFVGGALIVLLERYYQTRVHQDSPAKAITYQQAVLVGLFQSLAMIPGVSRAAATIMGGLALGIERKTIVEFSFLLAVPTMLAATGYDLLKSAPAFTMSQVGFLFVGFISSFVVAILSIKLLLHYIKSNNFAAFGYYRMLLALAFWILQTR
jgi:undecaprenyl-diphosphatase